MHHVSAKSKKSKAILSSVTALGLLNKKKKKKDEQSAWAVNPEHQFPR